MIQRVRGARHSSTPANPYTINPHVYGKLLDMGDTFIRHLRTLAATLATLSGIGHIAALWHRELTEAALADALLGAVYLIIGLGLYGISRFTLFMAIAIPAAASTYMLSAFPEGGLFYSARLAIDAVVVFASAVVLWQVRHHASV